ncbi:transcriptional regulator [Bacillus canaveralius]|uniref:Transcriptional regulator n=1 Tax=Bacillus canaveralius TaxID=1403243 RepID=A0A2N5GG00_9BACI|nr:helix-turn-helix domain-containing protein [Bacillus canaveralius]PLR79694.1 transcriptional regulator [Bacillus canaveralius]PLR99174.1 transcriptional regulator [Bacillus canaveralius]
MKDKNGLGKRRSKLGKFLNLHSISQQEIVKRTGLSKSTISRLCQPEEFEPNMKSAKKIIKVLQEAGYQVNFEDFWGVE